MSTVWTAFLFFPVVGFVACVCALADVATRPAVLLRIAGVSRRRRIAVYSSVAIGLAVCGSVFGFGAPGEMAALVFWLGIEVLGAVGFVVGGWYLLIVRKWIRAPLRRSPVSG